MGNWELWLQPFELLSREWRCIAYDRRGSGETVVPLEGSGHAPITTQPEEVVRATRAHVG